MEETASKFGWYLHIYEITGCKQLTKVVLELKGKARG
jgi:hypothetical protein